MKLQAAEFGEFKYFNAYRTQIGKSVGSDNSFCRILARFSRLHGISMFDRPWIFIGQTSSAATQMYAAKRCS